MGMGNHQKFATALDIYFWTSKHEKLAKKHKIDENGQGKNVQKSCKFFTYAIHFWNDVKNHGEPPKIRNCSGHFFWTSKHRKTHKMDENCEKSHPTFFRQF